VFRKGADPEAGKTTFTALDMKAIDATDDLREGSRLLITESVHSRGMSPGKRRLSRSLAVAADVVAIQSHPVWTRDRALSVLDLRALLSLSP